MVVNMGTKPLAGALRPLEIFNFQVTQESLTNLIDFKRSQKKDDPERRQGLHGPYEEATLRKTGKMPPDYYDGPGDLFPWGLLIEESRSNILWQCCSNAMIRHPQFTTAYLDLALDNALKVDDYAKELGKLNKDWGNYLISADLLTDHHHGVMTEEHIRVDCAACSILTALAVRGHAHARPLFTQLRDIPHPKDRYQYLQETGMKRMRLLLTPDSISELKL